VELKGPFVAADLRRLASLERIENLALTGQPLVTVAIARGLASLKSVTRLWLWCDVTRTAMRYVVAIRGLQVLDVLNVRPPGRLKGFSAASSLEVFRCNHCLNDLDLIEIAACRSLKEIAAQSASLTMAALEALLDIPGLQSLDLEGSNFDDRFAARLSKSQTLRSLDVGATRLTREGLKQICRMTQLRSLDLWSSQITEPDVDLLAELPHLEYLSIGQLDGETIFNADTLLPRLRAIRSLERIWLDGVILSPTARAELDERYKYVRVTN
jgi:hypothetical protein